MTGRSFYSYGIPVVSQRPTPSPVPFDISGLYDAIMDLGESAVGTYRSFLDKQRRSSIQDLIDSYKQPESTDLTMPRKRTMGMSDIGVMLGGSLLAKVLGASDEDLAQGLQGYMAARQQSLDDEYRQRLAEWQYKQQSDEARRRAAADIAKIELGDIDERQSRFDSEVSKMRDRAYEQKMLQMRHEQAKELYGMKRNDQRINQFIVGLRSSNPVIREQSAAMVFSGDPDAIAAWSQLSDRERLDIERGKSQNEGLALKNEAQRITNQYLPATLQSKLALSDSQKELIDTKVRHYPEHLRATMARVEVAKQLAANTISNTQFDNEIAAYKAFGGGKWLGVWQREIDGLLARKNALLRKDRGFTEGGVQDAVEINKIDQRVEMLRRKIEDELSKSGGGQVVPVAPGELQGPITPRGSWSPQSAKSAPKKPSPKKTSPKPVKRTGTPVSQGRLGDGAYVLKKVPR